MKPLLYSTLILFFAMNCASDHIDGKHIFYLHGMIIEIQGVNAVSDQFGEYRFNDIIDTLKNTGAKIHYEVRTQKTDFQEFCEKVSGQIDDLIDGGVKPEDITVVGASKGGIMAMNISNMNEHPVNYILLGANSNNLEKNYDWTLHGNILGIYEKSDKIAGKNYQYWIDKSKGSATFEDLEINTGLGHGFLFRPIKEWVIPLREIVFGYD